MLLFLSIAAIVLTIASFAALAPLLSASRISSVQREDEEMLAAAARAAMGQGEEMAPSQLGRIESLITKSGTTLPASEWLTRLGLGTACLAGALFAIGSPIWVVALGVVSPTLAMIAYAYAKRGKRSQKFEEQLACALPRISECLRAGESPQSALISTASFMENPIREEFTRAARDMSHGLSLEEAMDGIDRRVQSGDLKLLKGVIAVNSETGVALADVIDSISEAMEKRSEIKRHIRSETASVRFEANVIALIPWGAVLLLFAMQPQYFAPLLAMPLGWLVFVVAGLLDALGLYAIRKLTEMDLG